MSSLVYCTLPVSFYIKDENVSSIKYDTLTR